MIKVYFSLNSTHTDVHEFDLGHINIITKEGNISSKDLNKKNSDMMIFISISNLLDNLMDFYSTKNRKKYTFFAVDSCFYLNFTKLKNYKKITVSTKESSLDVDFKEFLIVFFKELDRFCKQYMFIMVGSGAVKEDLEYTLKEWDKFKSYYLN